jgi:PilZ domain/SPOR domain
VTTPNRRRGTRLPVEGLAYVNFEPDNGGIVLNISEGGLCFRSTNPVQETSTIRFWFSGRGSRIAADGRLVWTEDFHKKAGSRFIEAESELAWTDTTRKTGGLRFTNLPAGAREEIRDWISQHSAAPVAKKKAPPPFPNSLSWSATRPDTTAAHRSLANIGIPATAIQAPKVLNGFSGGLVTGVFLCVLVGAAFLLQLHSREFGDSLVHFGQRLGGKSLPQPAPPAAQPAPPKVQVVASEPRSTHSELQPTSSSPVPISRPESRLLQTPATTVKPSGLKLDSATPPAAAARFNIGTSTPAVAPKSSLIPFSPPAPVIAITPFSAPNSDLRVAANPRTESPNQPDVRIERSKEDGTALPEQRFLEVGKFNDKLQADRTSDKLSQLGFKATLVHKSLFWRKSYQILVGPYASDLDAEAAHKSLASSGFTPRSFARGTRAFSLISTLKLEGKHLPVGDYVISWESYVPDAIVRFESSDAMVTVQAKWVQRDLKYENDAIVYTKNPDGSRTLTEVRFSGMHQALVFVQAK